VHFSPPNLCTSKPPLTDGYNRLSGEVRYADGTADTYWFDTPTSYDPSTSGNPWLACLLPLAVTIGEDVEIPLPIDSELMEGALGLMRLWKSWYPKLSMVAVKAEVAPIPENSREAMAFFSAGVDSYFTVLRHPVKVLVNVLGFDMPLSKESAFRRHGERLASIAAERGAELMPMRTNIRETRWRNCHRERLGFGPALAAVALVLEKRFGTVFLPSSIDFGNLYPWGSHPLSDPLFSTSKLRIIHDGSAHSRVEKTAFIAQDDLALNSLHVCFRGADGRGQDDTNCCRCEKCYRTMATLEILGKLDNATLFDRRNFDVGRISRILTDTAAEIIFYQEIKDLALTHGRSDIAAEIDRSFRRSRWIPRGRFLNRLPLLWRLGAAIDGHVRRVSLA
jgi:hypothetical protein